MSDEAPPVPALVLIACGRHRLGRGHEIWPLDRADPADVARAMRDDFEVGYQLVEQGDPPICPFCDKPLD